MHTLNFEENFYNENGVLTETVGIVLGGVIFNIEADLWHNLRCQKSGTILLKTKNRKCKG